jgi:hypothetical protein
MSVLKKMQFVDALIIGAGAAECQNSVPGANGFRISPCFIAVR